MTLKGEAQSAPFRVPTKWEERAQTGRCVDSNLRAQVQAPGETVVGELAAVGAPPVRCLTRCSGHVGGRPMEVTELSCEGAVWECRPSLDR